MTPLELLAVGVIVVLVWFAGLSAGLNSYEKADFGYWPLVVLVTGGLTTLFALSWILALGLKEAAK